MARVTNLYDDIDGTPNAQERHFSIGDEEFVIDLTNENYQALVEAVAFYTRNARRVYKKAERKNYAPVLNKEDRSKIRAWAVTNGRYVPTRGRFPADVVRDYYASMEVEPKEFVYG